MVSAARIAQVLGDARREGRGWRCRCPLHGGRSLVVRDGFKQLLVTCWAGCPRLDVLVELRRRGLLPATGREHFGLRTEVIQPEATEPDTRRIARALNIWREAQPIKGTIVETYLRNRGIALDPWPSTLRFHSHCPRPKEAAGDRPSPLPGMVALVEHAGRGAVAVQLTYLREDGKSKAATKPQRANFGPSAGGAVRLGDVRRGEWLAVAEGIETSASVAVACAIPAWAALSAGGVQQLVLPEQATHVLVCADNDASGVGEQAAYEAATRFLTEGRRVRLALPSETGSELNAILLSAECATNVA